MLDSDRRTYVERTLRRFDQFLKELDELVARLKDMRGGYPSGGLNAGGGSSDMTQPERMAGRSDPADRALSRVDRLVKRVSEDVLELDNIRASTMRRKGAPDIADEGCRSCARAGGHSPVRNPGEGLCRWCYDRSLELDRDPPVRAVRWHLEGRKVTARLMADALAREAEEMQEAAAYVRSGGKARKKRRRHAARGTRHAGENAYIRPDLR